MSKQNDVRAPPSRAGGGGSHIAMVSARCSPCVWPWRKYCTTTAQSRRRAIRPLHAHREGASQTNNVCPRRLISPLYGGMISRRLYKLRTLASSYAFWPKWISYKFSSTCSSFTQDLQCDLLHLMCTAFPTTSIVVILVEKYYCGCVEYVLTCTHSYAFFLSYAFVKTCPLKLTWKEKRPRWGLFTRLRIVDYVQYTQ